MIHTHDYQIKAVQVSIWVKATTDVREQFRYAEAEPVASICLK